MSIFQNFDADAINATLFCHLHYIGSIWDIMGILDRLIIYRPTIQNDRIDEIMTFDVSYIIIFRGGFQHGISLVFLIE